jgi:hypothetical protein
MEINTSFDFDSNTIPKYGQGEKKMVSKKVKGPSKAPGKVLSESETLLAHEQEYEEYLEDYVDYLESFPGVGEEPNANSFSKLFELTDEDFGPDAPKKQKRKSGPAGVKKRGVK